MGEDTIHPKLALSKFLRGDFVVLRKRNQYIPCWAKKQGVEDKLGIYEAAASAPGTLPVGRY